MKKLISFALLLASCLANAQNIGIGTNTPQASAILDISSTNRGLLPPRMTAAQRNTIIDPANGLMVYDTDSAALMLRLSTGWQQVKTTYTPNSFWQANGINLFNKNIGYVGIGVNEPLFKLDINGRIRIRSSASDPGSSPGIFLNNTENTTTAAFIGMQSNNQVGFYGGLSGWSLVMNTTTGNVGIGTLTPKARLHVADSAVLFSSTILAPPITTTKNPPQQGPGTRMFWFPTLGAFRAGYVDGEQWDRDSIGQLSFAAGYNTKAKGRFSVALGNNSTASGQQSFAMGNSIASGNFASSFGGRTVARGQNSIAMGDSAIAGGTGSVALGYKVVANGDVSTSLGNTNTASGFGATSMGYLTLASGNTATTMGIGSVASGGIATSTGVYTKAKAYAGFTTGSYNDTTDSPNPLNIALTDRMFQIGNGFNENNRSNAFTVIRNGYVGLGNVLNPHAPLHFNNTTTNRKIVLWELANNEHQFYGLGVNGAVLRYQTPTTNDDHVFYAGTGTNASQELMRIKGNGFLGIGNSPDFRLDVSGRMRVRSGGDINNTAGINFNTTNNTALHSFVGVRDDEEFGIYGYGGAPGWRFEVNTTTGNAWLQGTLTQNSDARLKKNINQLSNTLDAIRQINGYSYHWQELTNPEEQIGLLAQELQKVYPQLVKENNEGQLSVNYSGMVPVLLQAIKEQQQQIENLKKMVLVIDERIK